LPSSITRSLDGSLVRFVHGVEGVLGDLIELVA